MRRRDDRGRQAVPPRQRFGVKRLNPSSKTGTSKTGTTTSASTVAGLQPEQGELLALYRYHCVFTDSPLTLVQAEKHHRGHAVIEQVHADFRSGPLAHLPSGSFSANGAWLILAAIAFNLTRAAGCLASTFHAKETAGTIRAQLINGPARLARSGRRLRLHLPERCGPSTPDGARRPSAAMRLRTRRLCLSSAADRLGSDDLFEPKARGRLPSTVVPCARQLCPVCSRRQVASLKSVAGHASPEVRLSPIAIQNVDRRTVFKWAAVVVVLGAVEGTRLPEVFADAPPLLTATSAGLTAVLVPGRTQPIDAPRELGVTVAGRGPIMADRGMTLTFAFDPRLYVLDASVTAASGTGPVRVTAGSPATDQITGVQSVTLVIEERVYAAFTIIVGHLRPRVYPLDVVRDPGPAEVAVRKGDGRSPTVSAQRLGRDGITGPSAEPWGCETGALWQLITWGGGYRTYAARCASALSTGPGPIPAGYRLRVSADSSVVQALSVLRVIDSTGRPALGRSRRTDVSGVCRIEWEAQAALAPGERVQAQLDVLSRPLQGPLDGLRHPLVELLAPAGAGSFQRTTYLESVVRSDSVFDAESRRHIALF